MRWFKRCSALALVLTLAGCAPLGLLRTARTVRPGAWEVAVGVGGLDQPAVPSIDVESYSGKLATGSRMGPNAAVLLRTGLLDWLDVGLRLETIGAALEVGLSLDLGRVVLGLVPSAGVAMNLYMVSSAEMDAPFINVAWKSQAHVQLPILVTIDLLGGRPRTLELTVGPMARWEAVLYAFPHQSALHAGGLASLSWQLSGRARLMLEFVYLHPVYDPWPALEASRATIGQVDPLRSPELQATVGAAFSF